MPPPRPSIHLGAFLPPHGHHIASWRAPGVPPDAGHDLRHYARLARLAEHARLDAVFLADIVAANLPNNDERIVAYSGRGGGSFEPLTLLSALSAVTRRIGLIATVTTTYNEPYHVARKLASLDHLSGGRAGWNLVTSANGAEAWNFGRDHHVEHARRYERAQEFVDVVTGLWDSWEDDAFPRDQRSGLYADPSRRHLLAHRGPHFQVRGPLNVARPPQGHPVRVQAGSSEPGKALAARTAELVFTAQQTIEGARAFYADLKGRLPRHGRQASDLKILPGLFTVVGRTQAEAQAKHEQLQDLILPQVGLALLGGMLGGVDLSGVDIDAPLPELPASNGGKSRQALIQELAAREGLSVRQLYLRIAGARGHLEVVGTPGRIADLIEEWVTTGAADGFNLMPATLPQGLADFVELVLPELRRRGLFRTEYQGRTLREHLGLRRPAHPRARAAQAG